MVIGLHLTNVMMGLEALLLLQTWHLIHNSIAHSFPFYCTLSQVITININICYVFRVFFLNT